MKYVFDLDGTICSQERSGEYHRAIPIQAMVKRVRELFDQGHEIIIFTARGMNTYKGNVTDVIYHMSQMTEDWLRMHDVPFHQIIYGKPAADFYIDDKGVNASDFLNQPGR